MAAVGENAPPLRAIEANATVVVPTQPATARPKRPQSAPAREPRVRPPAQRPASASSFRALKTHRENVVARQSSGTAARPHSARPASASSVRTGVSGNWGDGEERRSAPRKPPVPLSARARPRPQSAAAVLLSESGRSDARTRDPNDFARDECYTRLRKRYERSKGALGNSETGEPPARTDWFKPPRANVHCPACLLEEVGLREDLAQMTLQAKRDAAEAAAALKAMEEGYEQKLADGRSFELAMLKKMAERDDQNTALTAALAALRSQLAEAVAERDEMAIALQEA